MYNFKIDKEKHINFIKISSDKNPIHLIQQNLSKLNFEGTIVHGINIVLTVLDISVKKRKLDPSKISQIKCKFLKKVALNDILQIKFKNYKKNKLLIIIFSDEIKCLELEIFLNNKIIKNDSFSLNNKTNYNIPKINIPRNQKKIICINHVPRLKQIKKIYPYLSEKLNNNLISSIIMMSTSVGMFWPGKNSLFVGFDILFKKLKKKNISLKILKIDKRINYSKISYKSYYCVGNIFAFFTEERLLQPSLKDLSKKISKHKLRSHKALIIGGSRGLGELTSKIIAISGGEVTITYNSNKILAQNLVREFKYNKLNLNIKKFSINDNGSFNPKILKKNYYNCLYYYPTPIIYKKKKKEFNNKIYKNFFNIYCKALIKIIKTLKVRNLVIFYPSTIFNLKKNKDFSEYIFAKKVGAEQLKIAKKRDKIIPVIKKLPQLKTDQNNTIFNKNIPYGTDEIFKITIEIEKKLDTNKSVMQ